MGDLFIVAIAFEILFEALHGNFNGDPLPGVVGSHDQRGRLLLIDIGIVADLHGPDIAVLATLPDGFQTGDLVILCSPILKLLCHSIVGVIGSALFLGFCNMRHILVEVGNDGNNLETKLAKILDLAWCQNHFEAFGGDPRNVVPLRKNGFLRGRKPADPYEGFDLFSTQAGRKREGNNKKNPQNSPHVNTPYFLLYGFH